MIYFFARKGRGRKRHFWKMGEREKTRLTGPKVESRILIWILLPLCRQTQPIRQDLWPSERIKNPAELPRCIYCPMYVHCTCSVGVFGNNNIETGFFSLEVLSGEEVANLLPGQFFSLPVLICKKGEQEYLSECPSIIMCPLSSSQKRAYLKTLGKKAK